MTYCMTSICSFLSVMVFLRSSLYALSTSSSCCSNLHIHIHMVTQTDLEVLAQFLIPQYQITCTTFNSSINKWITQDQVMYPYPTKYPNVPSITGEWLFTPLCHMGQSFAPSDKGSVSSTQPPVNFYK